jgi:hypothetical protein
MKLNRLLGIEIYLVHTGHFLLFCAGLVILTLNIPWWAWLIGAPLVGFSVLGWIYEASIVLPIAGRLVGRASNDGGGTTDAAPLSPEDKLSE